MFAHIYSQKIPTAERATYRNTMAGTKGPTRTPNLLLPLIAYRALEASRSILSREMSES